MYLCKGYMAYTPHKLVTPIFEQCNLSIPLLKHLIENPPHKVKFVLITLQVTVHLLVEWSFTISITTSQPSCKVVTTLQGYKHLAQIATILSQPYKALARLLQPSYFHLGYLTMYLVVHYSHVW